MSYKSGDKGANRFVQNRFSQSAPVEEGKEYEADIIELSRRGDGIAKIEGFVIFVSGGNPGEHVKFRVTRVARRYAIAELV
jgi:predicted RNA-binding protein with TRAM domain